MISTETVRHLLRPGEAAAHNAALEAQSAANAAQSAANAAQSELDAMVGSVIIVPSSSAPPGYIKLNGALLSRATYADLWAFAQASGNLSASDGAWVEGGFSPGDGSATFRIPDARGNFLRAWDDGRGVDSGRAAGSLQIDAMQGHRHTLTDAAGTAVTIQASNSAGSGATGKYTVAGSPSDLARTVVTDGANGTPRIDAETRPRNIPMLVCIKY